MKQMDNSGRKTGILFLLLISLIFINFAYGSMEGKLEKLLEEGKYAEIVEKGEKYLANNQDAQDSRQVRMLVMKAGYKLAIQANTIEALESFQKKYPTNPFQNEIKELKSKIYYQTVILPANTIAAYRDFRERFPESSLMHEAIRRECELLWNDSKSVNTIESWRYFRQTCPESPHADEALLRESELAWIHANEAGSLESLEAFANGYKSTPRGAEALATVCRAAWEKTIQNNTTVSYSEFLKKYPDCEQKLEAEKRATQFAVEGIKQMSIQSTMMGSKLWVLSLAFSPDGSLLASGGWDESNNTVRIWDMNNQREIMTLNTSAFFVFSVAFSPDGKLLATGGCWEGQALAEENQIFCANKGIIEIWDVSTGQKLRELVGHKQIVYSVSFSPDGRMLASASGDRTIRIWDLSNGNNVKTITGHSRQVNSVAFSPDGRMLASASHDQTVKLWDADSGREIKILAVLAAPVWSVAFSPDGKMLAAGDEQQLSKVWEVSSGKELLSLRGSISSLAFSPAGKILAMGRWDSTISFIDVSTGMIIKTLKAHESPIRSIAFSPDSKILASSGEDNTINLWGSAKSGGGQVVVTKIIKTGRINDIVEDIDRPGNLYAATELQGILKSTDQGKTWQPAGWTQGKVERLFSTRGVIWAIVQKGVVFSEDGGRSWKKINMPESGLEFTAVAIPDTKMIYLGTNKGLFLTSDLGKTWQLRTKRGELIKWVDADPYIPYRVSIVSSSGETLLSSNGGKDWDKIASDPGITRVFLIPGNTKIIFASRSGAALLRSADKGTSWAQIPDIHGEVKYVKAVGNSECHLLTLTSSGLYESKDCGLKWAFVRSTEGDNLESLVVMKNSNIAIGGEEQILHSANVVAQQSLGDINFQAGSAELTELARKSLVKIIARLRENRQLRVRIEGYADDVGDDAANQVLSRRRAQIVMNYFVHNGIPANRFETVGYGKLYPVTTGNTENARAKNRRVVIYVLE